LEGDPANIVSVFADAGVETILIGGLAGQAHGALAPHHPYLRGAPPGLPFRFDRATIERGLNVT
jgi:hypothetical protein